MILAHPIYFSFKKSLSLSWCLGSSEPATRLYYECNNFTGGTSIRMYLISILLFLLFSYSSSLLVLFLYFYILITIVVYSWFVHK